MEPLLDKVPKSPEATTPETDNWCRKCGHSRVEVVPDCGKCGHLHHDSLLPDLDGETTPDKRTLMEFVEEWFQKDGLNPLTIDAGSGVTEPLALNMAWKDETDPEWTRLRTVMDSGAAESVGPPSMAPGVPIHESPGLRRGQAYIAAGHERIPNMGQQVLSVVTNEGLEAQTLYQIAEVTRSLTAVGSTCDRGNVVVYSPHGGCIINRGVGVADELRTPRGDLRVGSLDPW